MALTHGIQNTFAGGELAPNLHARVDIAKYFTGLKTARNVNILPQGGVRNRPGTYYVAAAGDSTHKVRLIPFTYSSGQSYMLEFGEGYIRFYTNGAIIADPFAAGAPAWTYPTSYYLDDYVIYNGHAWRCIAHDVSSEFNFPGSDPSKWVISDYLQIDSPYLSAELFDLKITQSADTLFIFHPKHAPQELIRYANDSWRLLAFPYIRGPFMLSNVSLSRTITPSASSPTTTSINVLYVGTNVVNGQYVIYLDTVSVHGLTNGQTITVSALNSTGAFLNGNKYTVYVKSTSRIQLYYLDTSTFVTYPSSIGYTPSTGAITKDNPLTLTANFDCFNALHVGALWQLTETLPSQLVAGNSSAGTYTSSMRCGNVWRLITTGAWAGTVIIQQSTDNGATWINLLTVTSSGNGSTIASSNVDTSGNSGASQCLIRAAMTATYGAVYVTLSSDSFDWNGILKIVTVSNTTTATASIINNLGIGTGLASTNATYQWAEGSWSDYRGWPTCGTFYQDRLVAASTVSEPQTVWFSQTADYTNFGVSFPLVDSDAISAVLPSRTVNIVKNMAVLGALVVLTSDSDFSIEPGSGGVLSPTSINIICHGHRGTSGTTPAIIGNELALVQQMGSVVRNLIYQFAVSGYMGDNIGVMSQHLLTGYSVVEMSYQQEPDSIVWLVRSDGTLLSFTYMREQEVIAWSRHDTEGTFESVAVIPNETLGINEVWLVVKRGSTRFIERMAKRDMGSDVTDYMHLDCAVTQDNGGSPSATVTGIDHLEGETVNALVDGSVVTGLTVASGSVTLPVTATVAHVGLPYVSDVETLRIDMPTASGTAQGRRIAIPELTIRFWNSRGGYVKAMSQDIDTPSLTGTVGFFEVLERNSNENLAGPVPLKTQDYKQTMNGGYDFGAHLWFRQVDPLPFCIIGLFPKVQVSDN